MKHCPECNRNYADPTLSFCLEDGTALLFGSAVEEPATAILSAGPSSESPTKYIEPRATATGGELANPISSSTNAITSRLRRRLIWLVGGVALLALIVSFVAYRSYNPSGSKQIDSIAVLPFENRSGSPNAEYLSDGLADSLIYRLAQLPNLKVSPTSSVMRYKGKETNVPQIANELHVDAVMSGRLVQRGDDLSISVQLTDGRTEKLIWAEQYDRKMDDLLATQREIASTIVDKLHLKLVAIDSAGINKKYTQSNEAYQLYLKGRFYWNKRDEENISKAMEQFKAAADADPTFALAYVGLADCYSVIPFMSSTSSSSDAPHQAKAYAMRALEIDDSLGEAHSSLGYAYKNLWNWAEAEKELKRGIDLNPNYATAHKFYGNFFSDQGRLDEALTKLGRAYELEPLSLIISGNTAEIYITKGDSDAAINYCEKALDLEPKWWFAHQLLALAYLTQGRDDEAVTEARDAVELSKRRGQPLGTLGYVYARTGRKDGAATVLKELAQRFQNGHAEGSDIARVYLGLGDKDQTYLWLEKDISSHSATLSGYVNVAPFSELRTDPRFKALTRKMGMVE